jgi:hypothetical protein
MSDPNTQAPTRLLDDPALDGALRHDLELARANAPVAYDVDAGLSRFEQTLEGAGAAPAASGAASTGVATGARVLGWVLGAAVLVGGGVGATWMMGQADAEYVRVATPEVEPSTKVRAEEAPVAGASSSDASESPQGSRSSESVAVVGVRGGAGDAGTAPAQAEGGSPALDAPAPPRPASKSPSATEDAEDTKADGAPESAPSLADEAKLINAARKALERDPAKALALVEEAEQLFPSGAMIQERRGYAILALIELGRAAEAEQRADAYLQRWPNGPLSRRVRDTLGGHP